MASIPSYLVPRALQDYTTFSIFSVIGFHVMRHDLAEQNHFLIEFDFHACVPSQAFIDVGMKWASYVVAVGAIMGIITSESARSRLCYTEPFIIPLTHGHETHRSSQNQTDLTDIFHRTSQR